MEMMWKRRGPYGMSWEDLGALLCKITTEVQNDGFCPDTLCAVARGGLVSAAYLATVLNLREMYVVRVRRTLSDSPYAEKAAPELEVVTPARVGVRVLVVDDIVGTGATARLVVSHLRGLGARDVRVATLAVNHLSDFAANYYGVQVDDWVVFPWEAGKAQQPFPMPVQLGVRK